MPNFYEAVYEPESFVSIVPMDYGEEFRAPYVKKVNRIETAAQYFSSDWNELTALITDPISFYSNKQSSWSEAVDWILCEPVTINVEHWTCSYKAAVLLTTFLKQKRISGAADRATLREHHSSSDFFLEINEQIKEKYAFGAFFAEFVIKTKTLNIQYTPPQTPVYPPLKPGQTVEIVAHPKFPPRYPAKKFTPPSLILFDPLFAPWVDAGSTQYAGTIHFDIGNTSAERAAFIVEWLENPSNACDQLNQQQASKHSVEWIKPGAAIPEPPAGKPPLYEGSFMPPGSPARAELMPQGPQLITYPQVSVEGVDSSVDCQVCVGGNVVVVNKTGDPESESLAYIQDLMVKNYCKTTPSL